jgi:hypothetical protein
MRGAERALFFGTAARLSPELFVHVRPLVLIEQASLHISSGRSQQLITEKLTTRNAKRTEKGNGTERGRQKDEGQRSSVKELEC